MDETQILISNLYQCASCYARFVKIPGGSNIYRRKLMQATLCNLVHPRLQYYMCVNNRYRDLTVKNSCRVEKIFPLQVIDPVDRLHE